jgi:hypothetical protein
MDNLESLSRRDLQLLAKQYGLKANAKSNELIDQIRAAEASSSSAAPAAVAVSVPVAPIDFSSADANAAACAKVQEMISAMNSSIAVDSSHATKPASSPASTVSSSAAADRKRWSVRSSGAEVRRSILMANSPSADAAASAEIAVVASTSPIAVAVSTPTAPVAELVCASTSRRKWGTRPSSGARMSLLESAILSPSPMDGAHSNAASTVTSPATVAPVSALAVEALSAPAEDDLLSELNRRVAQRVADGDIIAIPALKSGMLVFAVQRTI